MDKQKSTSTAAVKSAKNTEETVTNSVDNSELKTDKLVSSGRDEPENDKAEIKENRSAKKRKTNSRTPTPITIVPTDNISVVISGSANLSSDSSAYATGSILLGEKRDTSSTSDNIDKVKKVKVVEKRVLVCCCQN